MRGKLAKAIRGAAGFHPVDDRHYRMTNIVRNVALKHDILVPADTGTLVAVGQREGYLKLKARVKVLKKNDEWRGFSHA